MRGHFWLRTLWRMYCVVWFKKDLRLSDHAPLEWATEQARLHGGRVLPLWAYEPAGWQQPDASARHLGFANECLAELEAHISDDQGVLLRCHGDMLQVLPCHLLPCEDPPCFSGLDASSRDPA